MTMNSLRNTVSATTFDELSDVTLNHAVDFEGRILPAGASGTVVAAYASGQAYEVEFEKPFHAVVTLDAADIHA